MRKKPPSRTTYAADLKGEEGSLFAGPTPKGCRRPLTLSFLSPYGGVVPLNASVAQENPFRGFFFSVGKLFPLLGKFIFLRKY